MLCKTLLLAILLTGILFLSGCSVGNRFFYYPSKTLNETPGTQHLAYEDVYFKSEDGTCLHGWFMPAQGTPVGTVLHYHGNAQNIGGHYRAVAWFPKEGFNVFTFDYRGYGESEGVPELVGIDQDAIAAFRYLKSRKDIDPKKIVVLAQSLGGNVAIASLGRRKVKGIQAIALEATFYSYRKIAQDKIGDLADLGFSFFAYLLWPFTYFALDNSYSACSFVASLSPIPLLFIHGTSDPVISPEHSEMLFEEAKRPKQIIRLGGGRHLDAYLKFKQSYRKELTFFFKRNLVSIDE